MKDDHRPTSEVLNVENTPWKAYFSSLRTFVAHYFLLLHCLTSSNSESAEATFERVLQNVFTGVTLSKSSPAGIASLSRYMPYLVSWCSCLPFARIVLLSYWLIKNAFSRPNAIFAINSIWQLTKRSRLTRESGLKFFVQCNIEFR